ncbi:MAG: hypothetical protein ACOH2B_13850 [Burkholderiaceae bacterium]
MNTYLEVATSKLRRSQREAYLRRVMWLSFEERLRSVFDEIDSRGHDSDELGTLYLSSIKSSNPAYNKPWMYRYNSLNQAQLSVGWRRLGVWHTIGSKNLLNPTEAAEAGASICFSQDITGRVMVLLYPYKSDLAKVNEENFVLVFGAEPNDLTKSAIRRLIKTFFRYCVATSMISAGNYRDYLFRLWLGLRDIRNRKIQKIAIFRFVERLLLVALAVAGVSATLFTGNKWPF